jgi:hypothetical protein
MPTVQGWPCTVDTRRGIIPNPPYNNGSELICLLVHKQCELFRFQRKYTSTFSLKYTIMPALQMCAAWKPIQGNQPIQ